MVKIWWALSGKMLAYHILLRYVWSTTALRLGYESLEAEQELVILLVATMSFYPCTGYGKSLDFALLPEVIANSCSSFRDSYTSRRAAFCSSTPYISQKNMIR